MKNAAVRGMLLGPLVALCACGYHVQGRNSSLPKSIHVIAVPALENKTDQYRIEQKLTSATVHEFLAATPYKIVSNPAAGDAVLQGTVLSLQAVPLLFNTTTGSATTMLVTIRCDVRLVQTDSQKVLYHASNFLFRNEYEISGQVNNPSTESANLKNFFSELDPALDRMAADFAKRLVAAVTENY